MSLLGDLFDPVGAVANGGNNSTFDSIFNPGQDAFGNSGIIPSFLSDNSQDFSNSVGNFADSWADTGLDESKHLWGHLADNPTQLITGVDPAATKLWNAATNQNNTPWVNQYGGETNKDFQTSANKGIDTSAGQITGALANAIAGWYGGQALGGLASSAYGGAAGSGVSDANELGGFTGSNAGGAAELEAGGSGAAGAVGGTSGDAQSIYQLENGVGALNGAGALATVGNTTSGAATGGANSLNNGTNPFTGALKGGIRSGLGSNLDYAGGVGIDNPLYKAGINGAINGGVKAGMADTSNTGYGALVGALGGLAGQAGSALGSYFNQPTSGDGGASGTTNWGNVATGIGNYMMARRNDQGIQSQINGLKDLYSPNSAYAQQLQQSLQRQDAASGRGSQYGTRAVELQARLADAATRNAPTLANLYAQQRSNRFNQYAGLLGTARNSGALSGMFGQTQAPVMQNNYTPIQTSPSDYTQYDPNDARNNVMNTLPGNI